MLRARALQVGHPGAPATKPLDLTVGTGEWIALSGPNGAGKSALLLTLAGVLEPRGGHLAWEADEASPPGGAIGLALQNAEAQLLTDTVRHEIAFPLENLGWERARVDARVRTLLQEFELAPLEDRPLHALSGGEQARLAVACAVAADPAFLLLDEPGASMDARSRGRLLKWLADRVARGGTVVMATQLREEWRAAGRRLWLDEAGLTELPTARSGGERPGVPMPDGIRRWFEESPEAKPAGTPDALSYHGSSFGEPTAEAHPVLLELADVWHRFPDAPPDAWVLRHAHLRVRRGGTIVLRGPNGCGKTTLLHLLAGLCAPTLGAVRPTPDFLSLPAARRLGVLLQNPEDQLVGSTVLTDLCLGEKHPGDASQRRAADALAAAGLASEFLARAPAACSVGERRRIAWAGLLLLESSVWLLDEPTAGLDEEGLLVLARSIKRFNSQGGAVVVATQDERLTGWLTAELGLEGPCSVEVTPLETGLSQTPGGGEPA